MLSAREAQVARQTSEGPTINELHKIATLLQREREDLLARWREQVRQLPSAKHLDKPTLTDHVPLLIDELTQALLEQSTETIAEALVGGSPPIHGAQRFVDGYDIEEIVAEYNILRGCIHDLADAHRLTIQGRPFHILNRVLDGAIGSAVQAYATERALEVQQRRQEYLAFIAHDLRTPLNAISLAARVLELTWTNRDQLEESEQMLKSLRRNVGQLDALVAKVLEENTNSVTETGVRLERRTLDLWPLVEGLIHDLHPVAGTSSTKLLNQVPVDLIVDADASLLRRIFQNLIANAIRFTPRGEVEIGAHELADVGGAECWVRDNGKGVPPDRLDQLFDPMETDQRDAGGSGAGLGLAIVKTFVESHGGRISVESTLDAGSTFTFTLPLPRTDESAVD